MRLTTLLRKLKNTVNRPSGENEIPYSFLKVILNVFMIQYLHLLLILSVEQSLFVLKEM